MASPDSPGVNPLHNGSQFEGCPPALVLLRYAQMKLAPNERSEVQTHIRSCGFCDIIVTRLASSDKKPSPSKAKIILILLGAATLIVTLSLILKTKPNNLLIAPPIAPPLMAAREIFLEGTRGSIQPPAFNNTEVVVLRGAIPREIEQKYSAFIIDSAGAELASANLQFEDISGGFRLVYQPDPNQSGVLRLQIRQTPSAKTFDFSFRLR